MPIDKIDQEIVMTKYRGEDEWTVWTSDPTMATKIRKAGFKCVIKDGGYSMFVLPLKSVGFRKVRKRK